MSSLLDPFGSSLPSFFDCCSHPPSPLLVSVFPSRVARMAGGLLSHVLLHDITADLGPQTHIKGEKAKPVIETCFGFRPTKKVDPCDRHTGPGGISGHRVNPSSNSGGPAGAACGSCHQAGSLARILVQTLQVV